MAHKFPPLTVAAVERPDPTTVVLVVEHDAAQSYSRAVRPFAFRHAGAAIGARAASWTCVGTADRGTVEPDAPIRRGTRCLLGYVFRETAAYERDGRTTVTPVEQPEPAPVVEELPEATPEQLAHLFGAAPAESPRPRTVHVVNWTPDGVGGFEWRWDKESAERVARDQVMFGVHPHRDETVQVHAVELPAELGHGDVEAITAWLDAEGWSDGGDPRQSAA